MLHVFYSKADTSICRGITSVFVVKLLLKSFIFDLKTCVCFLRQLLEYVCLCNLVECDICFPLYLNVNMLWTSLNAALSSQVFIAASMQKVGRPTALISHSKCLFVVNIQTLCIRKCRLKLPVSR